jgi:hypothetical protein
MVTGAVMVQVNNFTGFETQGDDEAIASGSTAYTTTENMTGASSLRMTTAGNYALPWIADGITDAGIGYIVGVRFKKAANPASETFMFNIIDESSTSVICRLSLQTNGTVELQDANGTTGVLDTSAALTNDQVYYFEIYAELNSSAGDWEWFQDGVSLGSGTGADLTNGNSFGSTSSRLQIQGISGVVTIWDDMYILSGATAATDRLGGIVVAEMPQIFMYQNNLAVQAADISALSGNANTLNTGNWNASSNTPFDDTSNSAYTDTTVRSGLAYTNSGIRAGPAGAIGDTYHFDTSDAGPTDNDASWTNDANAFDGSTSTFARTTAGVGTITTNELRGEGTNAPASGGTINGVVVRVFGKADTADDIGLAVFTDGEAETLMDEKLSVMTTAGFSPYFALLVPSGGWTFAKIQALECAIWDDAGVNVDVYKFEVFVEHSTGSETLNGQTIDGDLNIRAFKGIWRADRTGGSGTVHTIYMGNDTDVADNFDSAVVTLASGTVNVFELLGETDVPLSTENFAQGFGKNGGGRDFDNREMWATLLHTPSKASESLANLSDGIMGTRNSFAGPFET